MSVDVDAMAAEVVLLIKSALSPVLAVQAAQQATIARLEARWGDIGALRERMALVEKSAEVIPDPVLPETLLAPVLDRIEALEARPSEPGPVGPQGSPGAPGADGQKGADGAPGAPGLNGTDGKNGADGLNGKDGANGLDGASGRDGRDGLPGVPGAPGEKGLDGINGKDGADGLHGKDGTNGLGFDDFEEVFDGERTYTRRYRQGDRVKEFVFTVPYVLDQGVYQSGKRYAKGDGVTWGGSFWIAQAETIAAPGGPSPESRGQWRLAVKVGRDGRDGKDAPGAVPVVRTR